MKTEIEREGPTRVAIHVEAQPEELSEFREITLRRLAGEVKIPGFRKGKAPRAVLEARLGKDTLRREFLEDALPMLYAKAAIETGVEAVGSPEIEIRDFEGDSPLSFVARVDVRPEVILPQYQGIEVQRPPTQPTDEEIETQLELLRRRFGTLEAVGRNAADGDFVTIDLTGHVHDRKVDEASATDLLYEVGSGSFAPQLDEELRGKRTGDILKFNAVLPEGTGEFAGREITFSVIVKEVQALRLPAADDEFAKTASEFDTLEDLRGEISRRVEAVKALEADVKVRSDIVEDLVDRSGVPVPDAMVQQEVERRLTHLLRELAEVGRTLDEYLESRQATQEQLVDAYKTAAENSVAADLILDAVARAEGIGVTDEELDEAISRAAQRLEREKEELREELEKSNRVLLLRDDILCRKALDRLVDIATITTVSE